MLPRKLWQYTNRKLFLALGGIILVSFIATATFTVSISQLISVRQSTQPVTESRALLQKMMSDLEQAESTRNAYVISPQANFLSSYKQASSAVPGDMQQLLKISEGYSYHDKLVQLQPLVNERLMRLAASINDTNSGDTQAALDMIRSGGGLDLMAQIRDRSKVIQREQSDHITQSRKRIMTLADFSRNIAFITLMLTLVLAGFTYYLFEKAIEAEHQLDRAKDDFVALASHQLRTPASGIKAILATLAAGDLGALTDRQLYFVQRALESNGREIAIIEELLSVAQADAGRLVLRPTDFDLGRLVESVVEEQLPHIESKGITLQIKRPDEPVIMHADQGKLVMAISNLVDNARKYTPENGHITVTLNGNHTRVTVEVADNGAGIEPGDAARLFDRFQRGQSLTSAVVPGTGLGLYLVRRVAELHQGTIRVSSKKGQGSRFILELPMGRAHAA